MVKPIEVVIIVMVICAWGGVLIALINRWGKEICRRIDVSRLR